MSNVTTRSKSVTTMGERKLDMKDIADSLSNISSRLESIDSTTKENKRLLDEQSNTISALVNQCALLEKENEEKTVQIKVLTERIETMEQYSKVENLVISGLDTRLYSSVVTTEESNVVSGEPPISEINRVENAVFTLFNDELGANVKESDISVMHYLPLKRSDRNKNKPKDIIVRFTNRRAKNSVMAKRYILGNRKADETKRNTNETKPAIFVNEHLTKSNATLFYETRQLRKQKLINNAWTFNCKIFVRTNGDTVENQKVIMIRNIEDLEQFRK